MQTTTRYVAGFLFDSALAEVALIRKNKPAWQSGLLNGIGGKIETGETALDAMLREFNEETGADVRGWKHFALLKGADFSVDFFAHIGDLSGLKSQEEEKIEIVRVDDIVVCQGGMVENVPWLIGLALDHLSDGRPHFVAVQYL